jgi:hypothetical protein
MRCLVKAIAMFGLGHYIYAGEDLPRAEQVSDSEVKALTELIKITQTDEIRLLAHFKVDAIGSMDSAQCRQAVTMLQSKLPK